jgi:hypothetical protein
MKKLWGILLISSLFSCGNTAEQELDQNKTDNAVKDESSEVPSEEKVGDNIEQEQISFQDEVEFAKYCATQFEKGNIEALRQFTKENILFSPYAFIAQSSARKVALDEVEAATDDIYYWGVYEGRGDSILLSTPEYFNKYVFNFDVNDKEVKVNTYSDQPKARGNELHNVQKIYPDAKFVEFYHPPSKEGYMDWNALIFVVEKVNDQYILSAIVHNQWTT